MKLSCLQAERLPQYRASRSFLFQEHVFTVAPHRASNPLLILALFPAKLLVPLPGTNSRWKHSSRIFWSAEPHHASSSVPKLFLDLQHRQPPIQIIQPHIIVSWLYMFTFNMNYKYFAQYKSWNSITKHKPYCTIGNISFWLSQWSDTTTKSVQRVPGSEEQQNLYHLEVSLICKRQPWNKMLLLYNSWLKIDNLFFGDCMYTRKFDPLQWFLHPDCK